MTTAELAPLTEAEAYALFDGLMDMPPYWEDALSEIRRFHGYARGDVLRYFRNHRLVTREAGTVDDSGMMRASIGLYFVPDPVWSAYRRWAEDTYGPDWLEDDHSEEDDE